MQSLPENRIRNECRNERCALDAGEILACSKVVMGEFDIDGKLNVLKLKMFDLESRDFESKTIVASDCPPEKLDQLAQVGAYKILKIETRNVDINIVKYKGREIKNKLEWAIAGGVTTAAAILYASSSGALSPSGKNKNLSTTKYDINNFANQHGAFGDLMIAARPHGMGGAFVGLSDDANAMAYNPAGMWRAEGRNVTAGYMDYRYGSGSLPYVYSGYVNHVTRTISHGQAIITSNSDDIGSSETQVITSFSKVFDDISDRMRPFSLGVNVKFLMMTVSPAKNDVYAWQDNAVEGGGFGGSLDIGSQFELSERITVGLLLRDILSTISYKNTSTGENYSEGVPANLVIGGHYRLMNTLNLVLDGNKSLYNDAEDNVRLGMEKWLFRNVLALRIGMSQNFSMESMRRYHFGLGIDCPIKVLKTRIGADYSYEYFKTDEGDYGDLSGAQRFSLGLKF